MSTLTWDTSHAVFVTELDDEHREIFAAVASLETGLADSTPDITRLTQVLVESVEDHFLHEERLMRAARYASYRWHKALHDAARKRVNTLVSQILQDDKYAGPELVAYLSSWLHNHTRLADIMLGAFLRNHRRIAKVTLRVGTKPAGSCKWLDSRGMPFDPGPQVR
jgi:hemerythrin-like metal-binding protein